MIEISITVRNMKKGLSAFNEDELTEIVADFMGVEYEDVELVWDFGDEEDEK